MKEFEFTVSDKDGIHARPAGLLVKEANKYNSDIAIHFAGKTADAKRIFSVMSLGIKFGDTFKVCINGIDENDVAENLISFLKNNL